MLSLTKIKSYHNTEGRFMNEFFNYVQNPPLPSTLLT